MYSCSTHVLLLEKYTFQVCQFFGDDKEIEPETRDSVPQSLTLERIKEFIKNHFKGVSTQPAIFELCLYADTVSWSHF